MKIFSKLRNKKVLIGFIIGIILIIGIITIIVLNSNKEETKIEVLLNDNLEFEINSEVKLLSLVSENNKAEITSKDELIDTSILGEKEIAIKYKDKEEKEYKFKIKIIDTQAPTIEYQKEITTTEGTEIDLLKDVKATDNSKEELEVKVEGEYDFNIVGTYNLKYVVEDSSKNKTEEDFTLVVKEKPKETPKPSTNQNNNNNNITSNNSTNNNSNNKLSPEECSQKYSKYTNKVFTSKPTDDPNIGWNVGRFYITKEPMENGGTSYQLHNEKISGHYIGDSASEQIKQIVGDLTEMRYTKENPLILYQVGMYSCN